MRNYSFYKNATMQEDGSNVSSVLYNICTKENNKKQEIINFIKSLPEQDITDINFIKTDRNDIMVQICESFGGKISKIDAPLLSDGTLRVLAIATLLYSIEEYSIVIIEEIDNGIHPSRAKILVKNIQDIATKRNLKIIVTSYNPALLDAIPSKIIGDILCCYREPYSGESCISRLKDLPGFVELILHDSLGKLMTKNKIEYFAKFPSNYEERKNRTLSWISELENE